jgi:Domain of unknown function (DUF4129)
MALLSGAAADPPAGEVKQRVREILAGDEFAEHRSVLQRIFDWIGDHFPRFGAGGGSGPGILGDLVVTVLVAGAVYLLVRLVLYLSRSRRPERPQPAATVAIDTETRRTEDEWRRLAETLERERRWREAVRARYGELLAGLVALAVVADVAGRTSGEYRDELSGSVPAGAEAFGEATSLFEGAWYGGDPSAADDVERFRELAAVVRREAKEAAAAAKASGTTRGGELSADGSRPVPEREMVDV